MPKKYNVTSFLLPKHKSYSATFRIASGKRVTRGYGTCDRDRAQIIDKALVYIHNAKFESPAKCPSGLPEEAINLYWDLKKNGEISELINAPFGDLSEFNINPADLKSLTILASAPSFHLPENVHFQGAPCCEYF